MRAKNRLSPYPILSSYSNDYEKGISFSGCVTNHRIEGNQLVIHVEFKLESPYLQNLVDQQKAMFLVHAECPETSYRKIESTKSTFIEMSVELSEITDCVELNTFIIACDNLSHKSDEFNEDYRGCTFDIQQNGILAIGDSAKIYISDTGNNLESFPSIIKIIKIDNMKGKSMLVDTDNEKIKIKLSADVCDLYKSIGNSALRNTAFALVVFPAIIVVISRMLSQQSELSERRWFKVLRNKLESKGKNLESLSIEDSSLLDICQDLFGDPIAHAFNELDKEIGRSHED